MEKQKDYTENSNFEWNQQYNNLLMKSNKNQAL
jgi:hypothetical protein